MEQGRRGNNEEQTLTKNEEEKKNVWARKFFCDPLIPPFSYIPSPHPSFLFCSLVFLEELFMMTLEEFDSLLHFLLLG